MNGRLAVRRPLLVVLLEPANLSRGTLYKNGEFFGADVGIDDEFGRLPFGPRTLYPPLGDDDATSTRTHAMSALSGQGGGRHDSARLTHSRHRIGSEGGRADRNCGVRSLSRSLTHTQTT